MPNMSPPMIEEWDKAMLSFIADRAARMGDASGLDGYYLYRLEIGKGLRAYERWFLSHLGAERALFHAGIGIGTLTAGLARCGVDCVGFEFDRKRWQAARALKDMAAPQARYDLRRARFPDGLKASDRTHDATLLFTNVGGGWDDDQIDRAIGSLRRFKRAFLDLRLFGTTLEDDDARQRLAARIVASGCTVTPIEVGPSDAHYVEVRPHGGVPAWQRFRQAQARAASFFGRAGRSRRKGWIEPVG